jgi:inorganic phosphate transporter, PiT family
MDLKWRVLLLSFVLILVLAFIFGYLNGTGGAANIVATLISSRAMSPRTALLLATLCMGAGPFVLGVAVAGTIGADLIVENAVTVQVVVAALLGAILWILLTLWFRIPCSSTQAFVGGLIGAVWAGAGWQALQMPGLTKTLIALFLSPLLGLFVGYWAVKLFYLLGSAATPHLNLWFKRGQVPLCMLMAVAFGANDGQKIMGIVVLGAVATGILQSFAVPVWIMAYSALAIGAGTLIGSWRLIHTIGGKFYKIRPIHGFGAQVASSVILVTASTLGGPVSSSQVVTSAIVGAGSADRMRQVRWNVVQQILTAWLFTVPASALAAAGVYIVIRGL